MKITIFMYCSKIILLGITFCKYSTVFVNSAQHLFKMSIFLLLINICMKTTINQRFMYVETDLTYLLCSRPQLKNNYNGITVLLFSMCDLFSLPVE